MRQKNLIVPFMTMLIAALFFVPMLEVKADADTIYPKIYLDSTYETELNPGDYYKTDLTLYAYDNVSVLNMYKYIDGERIIVESPYHISEPGEYIFKIKDTSDNESTYSFIIDKEAPLIEGALDGSFYNADTYLTITDNYGVKAVYFNDVIKSLNSDNTIKVSATTYSNKYVTIRAVDRANNETIITICMDKISPTISGVRSGNVYKTATINCTDTIGLSSLKYGVSETSYPSSALIDFDSGTVFDSDGYYYIVAYDYAGNGRTTKFVIDNTAPEIMGVEDGTYYNSNKTLTFSDNYSVYQVLIDDNIVTLDNNTYTLNIADYPLGYVNIKAYDTLSNFREKTIYFDTISPTITGVDDYDYVGGATISYTDDIGILYSQYSYSIYGYSQANMTSFISDREFTQDGYYFIQVSDYASNTKTLHFIIDNTSPTITGAEDGVYYNSDKTLTFSDNIIVKSAYINGNKITLHHGQYTVLSSEYSSSEVIVEVVDYMNNTCTISFFMDNISPTTNIINDNYYNTSLPVYIYDDYKLSASSYLEYNGIKTYFNIDDNNQIESCLNASNNGEYNLFIEDMSGNNHLYHFYIDTVAPTASLIGYTKKEKGYYYLNGSSTLSLSCDSDTYSITFNNEPYINNSNIVAKNYEDGIYDFVLVDLAGNTTTYSISIKSSVPELSISGEYQIIDDIYYFNMNQTFNAVFSENSTLEINGIISDDKEVSFSLSDFNEGLYNVILYDEHLNIAKATIYVDRNKDLNNYNYLKSLNYSFKTHYYNTFTYRYNGSSFVPNEYYSFSDLETAKTFARMREEGLVENIIYNNQIVFYSAKYGVINEYADYENKDELLDGNNVYIYKSISNPNKYVVYFSYDTLYSVIEHYVESSISEYYRFFDSDDYIKTPYNQDVYYDVFYIKGTNILLDKAEPTTKIEVTNSGITKEYGSIVSLSTGINFIKEYDFAGNISEYTVIISDTKYTYRLDSENNSSFYQNELENNKTIYAVEPITLSIDSTYDNHYIFKIEYTSVLGEISTYYILDQSPYLEDEGKYIITSYDIFSNTSNDLTIYIKYESPEIESLVNKIDDIDYSLSFRVIDYDLFESCITNILVKYMDENHDETYIFNDSKGNRIDSSRLSYEFLRSGQYTIYVTDRFGYEHYVVKELNKPSPVGELRLTNETKIESGTKTNKSIYFAFNKNYGYTCLLNGEPYMSSTTVSKEGIYTFILSNGDKSSSYTIEIDKTTPKAFLYDGNTLINSGEIVSSRNVFLTWDEEAYVYLNSISYQKGAIISDEGIYNFIVYDDAGNESSYTITIDLTPPEVIILNNKNEELESGSVVNSKIKFVWQENGCKAYVNGLIYTNGEYLSEDGEYILTIEDASGNSKTYTITIDKSIPNIYVFVDGIEVLDNTKLNRPFYVVGDEKLELYINNEPYQSGTQIKDEGIYTIKVVNAALTSSTKTITLSFIPPTIEIYKTDDTLIDNNSTINTKFYLSWNDTKDNRFTCFINDEIYTKEKIIRDDGEYFIKVVDEFQNETTYFVKKDTTSPVISVIGINDYNLSNQDIYITWDDLDISEVQLNNEPYYKVETITEEGEYYFFIIDNAGNETSCSFTIDKTPIEVMINGLNELFLSNDKVSFTWDENESYVKLNGKPYIKGKLIKDEGDYVFEISDKASNVTTISFSINKSIPSGVLSGITGIDNYSNIGISLTFNDDLYAYLDGESYESSFVLSDEGTYIIYLYNKYGSYNTYEFIIDKTPPLCEILGINDNYSNKEVSIVVHENDLDIKVYKDEDLLSIEDDYFITKANNPSYNGNYIIIVEDKASNQVRFEFEYYYNEVVENIVNVSNKNNSTIAIITPMDGYTVIVNDEVIDKEMVLEQEGTYNIEVIDRFGNNYQEEIKIETIIVPDYTINNISTIIILILLSGLFIVVIIIKTFSYIKKPNKIK